MAIEPEASTERDVAVARARFQAAATGELRPILTPSSVTPTSEELGDFVDRILKDGTYAQAIASIGNDDPDLADV